jgi:plastocyanin
MGVAEEDRHRLEVSGRWGTWTPISTLVLLGLVLAGTGCAHRPAEVDQVHPVVRMLDNRYNPSDITIPVGGSVTFVGAGRNAHNAVATDGSWSTEEAFGGLEMHDGDEATITFDKPGTYTFFCTFHGNAQGQGMAGTLTVVPADDTTP